MQVESPGIPLISEKGPDYDFIGLYFVLLYKLVSSHNCPTLMITVFYFISLQLWKIKYDHLTLVLRSFALQNSTSVCNSNANPIEFQLYHFMSFIYFDFFFSPFHFAFLNCWFSYLIFPFPSNLLSLTVHWNFVTKHKSSLGIYNCNEMKNTNLNCNLKHVTQERSENKY